MNRQTSNGLRTRYFPRSRIGQGTVFIAPWIDVVLLLVFFLLAGFRVGVQPGFAVSLPVTGTHTTSPYGKVAVVMCVEQAGGRDRGHVVFFDDERFLFAEEDQRRALQAAIEEWSRGRPEATLIICADSGVTHGVLLRIVDIASKVGVGRVNLATRSELSSGH